MSFSVLRKQPCQLPRTRVATRSRMKRRYKQAQGKNNTECIFERIRLTITVLFNCNGFCDVF